MDTNVNYTIVGAFVLVLLIGVILGIIWLSSGFSFEKYSTYAVYMQESVSGVSIDAPVEYNGVDMGTVKSIELNHKNPQWVELLLSIKSSTPITRGTVATLYTRGITGITFIALKDKGTDLRPLVAGPGQPYPVIKTAPSIFLRLDTALGQLSHNFDQITRAIQTLLDKENQQSIKAILTNIQEVTHTLAMNNLKLNSILLNTERATRQVVPLIQSSSGAVKILETQMLPTTYRLLMNVDETMRTLSEVAKEIKQNPSVLVRGIDRQPLGPGEKK